MDVILPTAYYNYNWDLLVDVCILYIYIGIFHLRCLLFLLLRQTSLHQMSLNNDPMDFTSAHFWIMYIKVGKSLTKGACSPNSSSILDALD